MSIDYRKTAQTTGRVLNNLLKAAGSLAVYYTAIKIWNIYQNLERPKCDKNIPVVSYMETRSGRKIVFDPDYKKPFYNIRDEHAPLIHLDIGEEFCGREVTIKILNYSHDAYTN